MAITSTGKAAAKATVILIMPIMLPGAVRVSIARPVDTGLPETPVRKRRTLARGRRPRPAGRSRQVFILA